MATPRYGKTEVLRHRPGLRSRREEVAEQRRSDVCAPNAHATAPATPGCSLAARRVRVLGLPVWQQNGASQAGDRPFWQQSDLARLSELISLESVVKSRVMACCSQIAGARSLGRISHAARLPRSIHTLNQSSGVSRSCIDGKEGKRGR